jgi:hypothetical protein
MDDYNYKYKIKKLEELVATLKNNIKLLEDIIEIKDNQIDDYLKLFEKTITIK